MVPAHDGSQGAAGGPAVHSLNWGVGRYEHIAEQLLPAAREVVQAAAIRRGDRVLDLGCGTGNAALLAAELGGRVTGVDPAERLLTVARDTAAQRGIDIEFVRGEAASVPLPDRSVDVVLSVFAVIFAPDADAAADEMARVAAPEGRIVLSAWIPGGAISEMNGVAAETFRRALDAPAGPQPFSWHDLSALSGLLVPRGFDVTLNEHLLAFTAPSASAFLEEHSQSHPRAVAGLAALEARGEADSLRQRLLQILESGNEDDDAFCVTSRYVVAEARRIG
jgi:SAM-dependent methyltransferase